MDYKIKTHKVVLSSDVFRSCLFHSYLTSAEEIAGLLLGYVETETTCNNYIIVIYLE
jgi:hypothetical protein